MVCSRRLSRTTLSRTTCSGVMRRTEQIAACVACVAVAVSARMERDVSPDCSTAPSLHTERTIESSRLIVALTDRHPTKYIDLSSVSKAHRK